MPVRCSSCPHDKDRPPVNVTLWKYADGIGGKKYREVPCVFPALKFFKEVFPEAMKDYAKHDYIACWQQQQRENLVARATVKDSVWFADFSEAFEHEPYKDMSHSHEKFDK